MGFLVWQLQLHLQHLNAVGVTGEMPHHAATIQVVDLEDSAPLIGLKLARAMVTVQTLQRPLHHHPHHQRHPLRHQLQLLLQHRRNQCPHHLQRHAVLVALSCLDIWKIGPQRLSGGTRTCLDIA